MSRNKARRNRIIALALGLALAASYFLISGILLNNQGAEAKDVFLDELNEDRSQVLLSGKKYSLDNQQEEEYLKEQERIQGIKEEKQEEEPKEKPKPPEEPAESIVKKTEESKPTPTPQQEQREEKPEVKQEEPEEKEEEKPEEKPEEKEEEKPEEKQEEKQEEKEEEKPEEKQEEKEEEKPEEKQKKKEEDKPEEKQEEKEEKPEEKQEEKEDKPEENPEESKEDKQEEKPGENQEDKRDSKPEENQEDKQDGEPEESQEDKPASPEQSEGDSQGNSENPKDEEPPDEEKPTEKEEGQGDSEEPGDNTGDDSGSDSSDGSGNESGDGEGGEGSGEGDTPGDSDNVNPGDGGAGTGGGDGSGEGEGGDNTDEDPQEPEDINKKPIIECSLSDGVTTSTELRFTLRGVDYKGRAIDPFNYKAWINGSQVYSSGTEGGYAVYRSTLPEGSYEVTVYVTDSEGNDSSVTYTAYAEGEPVTEGGHAYLTIDMTSIGHGIALETVADIYEGQSVASFVDTALRQNGFTPYWRSGWYLERIGGVYVDVDSITIPEAYQGSEYLDGQDPYSLGEKDVVATSGWLYYLNGSFMDVGMGGVTLMDGDEVYLYFTLGLYY